MTDQTICTQLQARLTAFKEELDALELQLAHFTQSGSARESVRLKSVLQQLSEKRNTFFEEYKKQAEEVFWRWVNYEKINPLNASVTVDTDGLLKVESKSERVNLEGDTTKPFLFLIKEANVDKITLYKGHEHLPNLQKLSGSINTEFTSSYIYAPQLKEFGDISSIYDNLSLFFPKLEKANAIILHTMAGYQSKLYVPSLKSIQTLSATLDVRISAPALKTVTESLIVYLSSIEKPFTALEEVDELSLEGWDEEQVERGFPALGTVHFIRARSSQIMEEISSMIEKGRINKDVIVRQIPVNESDF
ncbi:hypothetical protein HGA88_06655 [Candidatus Roizmanbacteria bacterium]|nr:hypothetical protein [Candidatus Roizmanbacteria bacterium]